MAKTKRQKWESGDCFAIPMDNDIYGLGQVISHEKHCMDSVLCALFDITIESLDSVEWVPSRERVISVRIVTRESLDKGFWPIVGREKPISIEGFFPISRYRDNGYVGVSVDGSAIIDDFIAAFNGLIPWDSYFEPDYFDKMLVEGVARPENVVFK